VSNASDDLPEPGQAGEHDERVARQRDADVLEVVLPGSRDDDLVLAHAGYGV
jgi:hypothetical protein